MFLGSGEPGSVPRARVLGSVRLRYLGDTHPDLTEGRRDTHLPRLQVLGVEDGWDGAG